MANKVAPLNQTGPREVALTDIPRPRTTLARIVEEAKAHAATGKQTALAYYRTNANMVSKLRKMGLDVSSRTIPVKAAKQMGIDHGKRGATEIFVRYLPGAQTKAAVKKGKA